MADPLETESYSPIDHLNTIFGESSSNLEKIPSIVDYLGLYGAALDRELAEGVKYTDEEREALRRTENASQQLQELLSEIQELKDRAAKTESSITDMTSDIKKLDQTKANLVKSITVLKRLQMLITAYDQLVELTKTRQYRELAQTLPAVLELVSHFKSFRSVSQVAQLSRQVSDIQFTIADQIMKDFSSVVEGKGKNLDLGSRLADACVILDSLGESYHQQLVSWYTKVQLREYRSIFKVNDEAGSLDNVSRRYAYLKRLLKRHLDDLDRYFLPSWKVSEELCLSFCTATREDLQALLATSRGNINVQLLLQALEDTLEFETYLEKKFGPTRFHKAISLVFQPHLNLWIEHQDKELNAKFGQFKAPPRPSQEDDADAEGTAVKEDPSVLPSSADLFVVYRQILSQTSKLSTGPPLLDLSNLFGKWLSIYCYQILRPVLPAKVSTVDDIKSAAIVLNTADYCFTTTTHLEQRVIDQLDDDLKEKVDMEKEKNAFLETISIVISLLVNKVLGSSEFAWREMINTNWTKLKEVGDQSTYVSELRRAVNDETKAILERIDKDLYVRMFCDKVVEAVSSELLQRIAYCRPISEVAAQQMLLDLSVIKESLLKLPMLKVRVQEDGTVSSPKEVSNAYVRHVNHSVARVETVLKVILTKLVPAEDIVQNYFYVVGDSSAANFTKILELKGVTRSDQNRLLELFTAQLKAHDNLIPESPVLAGLRVTNPPSGNLHGGSPSLGTNGPFLFEPPKVLGSSLLSKEGLERFTHGSDAPVNRLNENFKSIGRLFRRDGSGHSSPLSRNREFK